MSRLEALTLLWVLRATWWSVIKLKLSTAGLGLGSKSRGRNLEASCRTIQHDPRSGAQKARNDGKLRIALEAQKDHRVVTCHSGGTRPAMPSSGLHDSYPTRPHTLSRPSNALNRVGFYFHTVPLAASKKAPLKHCHCIACPSKTGLPLSAQIRNWSWRVQE